MPPRPRQERRSLRFLASTCVFSAWATLVLSLIGAFMSFAAGASISAGSAAAARMGAPSSGGLGGLPGGLGGLAGGSGEGGLGSGSSGNAAVLGDIAGGLFSRFVPPLLFGSGIFTLVTGIVTFVLFLGLGQACYALLDLEAQSHEMNQMLQIVVARLGTLR